MAKKSHVNLKELTDQVYDLLLDNVGMSEFHVKFPFFKEEIVNQEVNSDSGVILLQLGNKCYEISIKELNYNPFMEE